MHEPPDAVDWTLSDIAVDWAREVGGYELDEWQEWLVRWTFVRRQDRLWAARDVGGEVTRQSGKNIWLEVVEGVSVFEFGDNLVTHSAHRADVSHEHFLSLRSRIESNDDLMRFMPTWKPNNGFITTNGNESIELANGARILFKARAKASGRGPRPQKIIFDEALILDHDQIGSMAPAISAQRNPQLIFASSPPKSSSEVLHSLRSRALKPEPGDRLFYAAWNNDSETDINDREACYRVNPSLGYGRMTEESLLANRKLMSEAEFLREHLGVPETPADELDGPIGIDRWDSLKDEESAASGRVQLALDVSPDQRWATFAIAGRRSDGLGHVATRDRRKGTAWVLERGTELARGHSAQILIDPRSPAGAFIAEFTEAGVEVVQITGTEYAQSCGALVAAVENGKIRHRGTPELRSAIVNAAQRTLGDAWAWSRRNSSADITPLVAATLAWGRVPAESRAPVFAY